MKRLGRFAMTTVAVLCLGIALPPGNATMAGPIGWHYNDLTAAAGAPPGSVFGNPAGYVFDAQATQHVIYRTPDIVELWWDTSGWHYNDLTVAAGGAPAQSLFVRNGYVFDTQGTQHVPYIAGNPIIELWWDSNGWHYTNLTAATGAPPGADLPYGYVFDAQGTQHVVYSSGDHIIELWWNSSGWHYNDLTVAAGGAPPAGGARPVGYVFDAQGTQHVIYRTPDGHIVELWWDSSGWHYNDLTAAAGGAPSPASQPTAGYVFKAQGTQHVVYLAGGGQIIELWWDSSGWHYNNLNVAAGGAPPASSDPTGYVFDAQGTQHVVYFAQGDGHMIELWWDRDGWHHNDLTLAAGGAPQAGGRPIGYVFDAQGTQHVIYYAADDGHVIELWWGMAR